MVYILVKYLIQISCITIKSFNIYFIITIVCCIVILTIANMYFLNLSSKGMCIKSIVIIGIYNIHALYKNYQIFLANYISNTWKPMRLRCLGTIIVYNYFWLLLSDYFLKTFWYTVVLNIICSCMRLVGILYCPSNHVNLF